VHEVAVQGRAKGSPLQDVPASLELLQDG
jgi:hypothetical protein